MTITGIFLDLLVIAGTLYSTDLLFQKREICHLQLTAILFLVCFIRGFYLLYKVIDKIISKKYANALFIFFHFILIALIDMWLFTLFFMHLGAPSVGD